MKKVSTKDLTIDCHSTVDHKHFVYSQLSEKTTGMAIATGNNLLVFLSQQYQRLYDVGIVEWRVMMLLEQQPGVRLVTMCNILMADKAGISRALGKLRDKRLVTTKDNQWNKCSKFWKLTPAGLALHGVIAKESNRVSETIMAGIPTDHALLMCSVFQKLNDNLETFSNKCGSSK